MAKRPVLSLAFGALLIPAWAAVPGQAIAAGEVLRPSAEQWCPEGEVSSPGNDCITRPILLNTITPAYPEIAKMARIAGRVDLEATIGESGDVVDVRVISSHPVFKQAAVDAVSRRRYKPAYQHGVPVRTCVPITVRFDLVSPTGRPQSGPNAGAAEVVSVTPYESKSTSDPARQERPPAAPPTGKK